MSKTAYIGIGSNMGSPLANCRRALILLEEHSDIKVVARSSFYETEPVGGAGRNWFINAAAEISTGLEPDLLLKSLLEIENAMGRIRKVKWGPRIIDLDVLLYEKRVIKTPQLEIPHPEMHRRRFALTPLIELAPRQVHPVARKTIQQLLSELPEDDQVVKIHALS